MNEQEETERQAVNPTTPVLPEYPYHTGIPTTSDPYSVDEIGIPPPPPPHSLPRHTSKAPMLLGVSLIVALLLFASAGLFYLAITSAVNHVQPTHLARPVTVTATPTPSPTAAPPTPMSAGIGEPPTPTPMIVPYTASRIFQDFQAAGIAMSNVHSDNDWCHACGYTPSGGAVAWNSENGTPTEIATFATTHALQDDAQTLGNDGMHGKYVGRCLLFYNASTLSDIDAYVNVMRANCY